MGRDTVTSSDSRRSSERVCLPGTMSTAVMYSDREFNRRCDFDIGQSGSSNGTFVFGDVSEVSSWINSPDSKNEVPGDDKEEGNEETEEEEEEEEFVDWRSSSATNLSFEASGSSSWQRLGRAAKHWDDKVRPGNGILDYYSLELDEIEVDGFLTDRIIATGQSCLDRCPGSQGYVYTKLVISGKKIMDISILQYHRYLQYIDLSWNRLHDASPLGFVRYLIHLDLSHNKFTIALEFKAPFYLTYVDYSYNYIEHLSDLSDFWSVKTLKLTCNCITRITGLHNLRYLQYLDLSHNLITKLENLSNLRITELNLEGNNLSEYDEDVESGLASLYSLKYLNLNDNKFTTLGFLKGVFSLRSMEMRNNKVAKLFEVDHMKCMMLLEELDFTLNEITKWPSYRAVLIFSHPSLGYLDGTPVSVGEKVSAKNRFEPDEYEVAASNHARILLLEQMNCPKIDYDILPLDQPLYPLIVLVGPTATGKFYLMDEVAKKFGNKVHIGIRHTTRPIMKDGDEVDGVDYYFVDMDKFNEMVFSGAFLCTSKSRGNSYGFSRMELAKAVKKQCMCITCMELTEALTLRASGIRPCLILAICENETLHIHRLKNKYYTPKISKTISGVFKIQKRPREEVEDVSQSSSSRHVVAEILNEVVNTVYKTKLSNDLVLKQSTMETLKEENTANTTLRRLSSDASSVVCAERLMQRWQKNTLEEDVPPHVSAKNLKRSVSFKCTQSWISSTETGDVIPCESEQVSSSTSLNESSGDVPSHASDVPNEGSSMPSLFVIHEPTNNKEPTRQHLDSYYSSLNKMFPSEQSLNVSNISNEPDSYSELVAQMVPYEDAWIRKFLQSRYSYLAFHQRKPGFFEAAIFTDDLKKASCKLNKFLKVYLSKPNKRPIYSPEEDPVYEKMVLGRVNKFTEDIDRRRSTMAQQQHDIFYGRTQSTDKTK